MLMCILGRYVASSLVSTQTFRRSPPAFVASCAEVILTVLRKVPESDAGSVEWKVKLH